MNTGVRETLCSKCLHCQICSHKENYLNMVKRLEELFYSVPEKDRSNMTLQDPACKFNQKPLEIPSFVNQGNRLLSPEEVLCHVEERTQRIVEGS